MRGMMFPLDFVWINGDKVVDLSSNIAPPSAGQRPVIISPDQPANLVLEVNAGVIERLGITVGATVKIRA